MNIEESIKTKRTIRLFKQDKIPYEILEKCVNAARLSSSARNSQPLEYIIIDEEEVLNKILKLITFGGSITEDRSAKKGFEPKAVIIVIVKEGYEDYYKYDMGIALQNISLVAFENNIGSVMQGAIEREDIKKLLNIPNDYFVDAAISLGVPAEQPVVEETDNRPSNYGHYRKDNVLHVQKIKLSRVLHRNKF